MLLSLSVSSLAAEESSTRQENLYILTEDEINISSSYASDYTEQEPMMTAANAVVIDWAPCPSEDKK